MHRRRHNINTVSINVIFDRIT